MEALVISAFLEELVYESDVKCPIRDLFDRVEDRGILCDSSIKVTIRRWFYLGSIFDDIS